MEWKKFKVEYKFVSLILFIIGLLLIGLRPNMIGAVIGIGRLKISSFLGIFFIFCGLAIMFAESKLERIANRPAEGGAVKVVEGSTDKPPSYLRVVEGSTDRPSYLKLEESRLPEKIKRKLYSEEDYEKSITPELLKHFSKNDALKLVKYFEQTPRTRTQEPGVTYDLHGLKGRDLRLLEEEVHNKRVIEFGDAGRNINKYFFRSLGAKKLDSFNYETGKGNDALSYLSRQPSNSAVVVSLGVLDEGVLYNDDVENLGKYTKELAKQIYRVTPEGGITIHGLEYKEDLVDAGFEVERVFRDRGGEYLMALRKPKNKLKREVKNGGGKQGKGL